MSENFLIKGLNEFELKELCEKNSFPSYHGEQIYRWLYKHRCEEYKQMKNIPNKLISMLENNKKLLTLNVKTSNKSKIDNTTKYLLETQDGNLIETVSMLDKNRHTVCISSQVGCNVDCDFCATGKMGIIRNLTSGEIIDQIIIIQKNIENPINNIVFMGMGEPFLNYSNVIKACDILSDSKAFNLSYKRITISTSGILPKIKLFIKEEHKYKLAISLNASNNFLRNKIIPINKKWNIEEIIASLDNYKYNKTTPVMFEYVMLKDFNDKDEHAIELAKLLSGNNYKVNLIPFNEIDGKYSRPTIQRIESFSRILHQNSINLRILIRWSKGEDIDAACGQLATKNEN